MAKTTGPLFSLEASGTIAKVLNFQRNMTRNLVRALKKPVDRKSAEQLAQRAAYKSACNYWTDMVPAEKALWEIWAKDMMMNGFNFYMKTYLAGDYPSLIIDTGWLTIQRNAEIRKNTASTNYGNQQYNNMRNGASYKRRTLFYNDLNTLGVPTSKTIIDARVALCLVSTPDTASKGQVLQLCRITRDEFIEMEATWSCWMTDEGWTAAGGDYTTTDPVVAEVNTPSKEGDFLEFKAGEIFEKARHDWTNKISYILKYKDEDVGTVYQASIGMRSYPVTAKRPKVKIKYLVKNVL